MSFRFSSIPLLVASLLLFSGCTSFQLTQTNRFINDDGEIITVDYGTGEEDYESTFKAPNGREFEFKSRLRVHVTMPDGESFYAFQVMNELRNGTLYRSDNEKWSYHANGFLCTVYRLNRQKLYEPVFSGVVCQSPEKPHPEQRR